jgi:penicillin-binding protein 2
MSEHRLKIVALVVGLLFAVLLARLWQLQMVEGERYSEKALQNRMREERSPSPRGIIYDRKRRPLVKNAPFYYAAILPDAAKSDETDINAIALFLGMEADDIRAILAKNRNALVPIRLKGGLSFEDVAAIEARLSDYPSLVIDFDETRIYPYGEVGAHAVGYLGKLNPSQIKDADFRDVPRQAFVGQWGAEKVFNQILRGKPGSRLIETDALGRKLRIIKETPPEKGQDITLSIDIELQKTAEEAFGKNRGALV